jgi:hypothetical protein
MRRCLTFLDGSGSARPVGSFSHRVTNIKTSWFSRRSILELASQPDRGCLPIIAGGFAFREIFIPILRVSDITRLSALAMRLGDRRQGASAQTASIVGLPSGRTAARLWNAGRAIAVANVRRREVE